MSNVPKTMPPWLRRWTERHQHPVSFWLHMLGIPLVLAAVALALWQLWHGQWALWWRPTLLFVVGYLLQWTGHRLEGNDMGEVILVKRLLRRPYVAISAKVSQKAPEKVPG
jgi:hypothetical protein